jgi:hypothetical protein
MRAKACTLVLIAAFVAGLVLAGREGSAGAQQATKMLMLYGPNGGTPVGNPITGVALRGQGGSGVLTIEGSKVACSIPFSNMTDAAAIQQRILDPKTTTVKCVGALSMGNVSTVNPASEYFILATP